MIRPAATDRIAFDPLVAAAGVHGSTDPTTGELRYTGFDVAAAHADWLTGVVDWGCRAGHITLDDDGNTMLETLVEQSLVETVTLESRAVTTIAALAEHGIESRVLKGVAVAHLDYSPSEVRLFGDVDLLVRGNDLAASIRVLADAGFRRHYPEPHPGFDARIGKGVAVEDDSRSVIDLHRTLALGYFGTRLPIDRLWADTERFELCGVEVAALPRLGRLMHCALHMALSPTSKVVNGLDLCVLAAGDPTMATADILATAREWRCTAPLALAIQQTCGWFGDSWAPEGLAEWARHHRPRFDERLAMTSYTGRLANSRWRSLTAVAGLPTGSDRRTALRGMLTRGSHRRG